MNRDEMLEYCKRSPDLWDVIIIGGGATGLGSAVDAASRGYKTLLLEQSDFAKGTSSRSTKLIHGGLRYLKEGNISLVIEALKERGLLCQNAPHLVSHLGFLIPNYQWWEGPFYRVGLTIYDLLAGKLGIEKSLHLSSDQTLLKIPTLKSKNLRGGVVYYDGQFDDARLAITLAQTAIDQGAVVINYMPVLSFVKEKEKIVGVVAKDLESNTNYVLRGKTIINATGVFTDSVRKMDDPKAQRIIAPSQGIHLVVDRSFMPTDTAMLIPQTEDNRVLFIVPWHRHLLIGTTDTPVSETLLEPRPLSQEIDFLLHHAARYLNHPPKREEIRSVFTGLRPLVQKERAKSTASLSRDHRILASPSGLISITGGKWTTYRRMAQDVIDKAQVVGKLKEEACKTHHLKLHGYLQGKHSLDAWSMYGSNARHLEHLIERHPDWGHLLHPRLPYLPVEVIWAVRKEMARTLEDVLARRTRSLFLDVEAALEIAPRVASLMAQELGRDEIWIREQIIQFKEVAQSYSILGITT